jgi:hypothetical protein
LKDVAPVEPDFTGSAGPPAVRHLAGFHQSRDRQNGGGDLVHGRHFVCQLDRSVSRATNRGAPMIDIDVFDIFAFVVFGVLLVAGVVKLTWWWIPTPQALRQALGWER